MANENNDPMLPAQRVRTSSNSYLEKYVAQKETAFWVVKLALRLGRGNA